MNARARALIAAEPELAQAVASILKPRRSVAGVTRHQRAALNFIEAYIDSHQLAPTVMEVADGLGLSSKSQAHKVLVGLEHHGLISRVAGGHHGISIVESRT